jgi:enoyl-[acyl-carrier-protein] reductase (NADH)
MLEKEIIIRIRITSIQKRVERFCFFHKVMQVLYKRRYERMGKHCCLVFMAQRVFPITNDMADNKAYLESMHVVLYFFGRDKKVRVNTISNHQLRRRQVKCEGIWWFYRIC